MTSIDAGKAFLSRQRQRSDLRSARAVFCIAYPICLAVAVVGRLSTKPRSGSSHRSVFSEARASAASIIPFAFR